MLDGISSLDQAIVTEKILQLETPERENYISLIKVQLDSEKGIKSRESESEEKNLFHLFKKPCIQTQKSERLYGWLPSTITLAMQLG